MFVHKMTLRALAMNLSRPARPRCRGAAGTAD
jgi:hypothetical protein